MRNQNELGETPHSSTFSMHTVGAFIFTTSLHRYSIAGPQRGHLWDDGNAGPESVEAYRLDGNAVNEDHCGERRWEGRECGEEIDGWNIHEGMTIDEGQA